MKLFKLANDIFQRREDKMNPKTRLSTFLALLICLFITLPVYSSPATPDDANVEEVVLEQLREIEVAVAAIQEHANELQTMRRIPLAYTLDSHRYEWNQIETRVEQAGNLIPSLQRRSADSPDWQEKVIDRVAARLKAIGHETSKALKFLQQNRQTADLLTSEYEAYVTAALNFANDIDDSIDYLQARDEMADIKEDYTY